MISNYDLEDMAHFYKIDLVVVMKDELIKIKPISGNYIINLESSKDGNGTHWMGLKIENFDCVYFDSYGYLPPQEIIDFCKRIHNSHLAYNTKEIQNLSTTTCGFYAFAFLLFLHLKNKIIPDLFSRSSAFSNFFNDNTKYNNKNLQLFYKELPNSSHLQLLRRLYNQK